MTAYDDLLAERYSRATHAWWKTPERTVDEEMGATLRTMLLRATQEADELHAARTRAGQVA